LAELRAIESSILTILSANLVVGVVRKSYFRVLDNIMEAVEERIALLEEAIQSGDASWVEPDEVAVVPEEVLSPYAKTTLAKLSKKGTK